MKKSTEGRAILNYQMPPKRVDAQISMRTAAVNQKTTHVAFRTEHLKKKSGPGFRIYLVAGWVTRYESGPSGGPPDHPRS